MQFFILGPLAVRDGNGTTVPVGGARLRKLLVLLLLDSGRTVTTTRLIDGIWADTPPASATNALQALVSRLRRVLGNDAPLHGDSAGYRLDVPRSTIDLRTFEGLVATGYDSQAAGDPRGAAHSLGDALALWRGAPLADLVDTDAATDTAIRLTELRQSVTEERLACLLDAGDHQTALPDIEALVAREPLRERSVELLMRALHACGRQADALDAYHRLRDRLTEELGIDPSPRAQNLHLQLLRGELAPPVRDTRRKSDPPAPPPRMRLPQVLTSFVARDTEVATAVGMLRSQRLVTMTGPGGSGKTRLAIETGTTVTEREPTLVADGACFVDLAPVGAGSEIGNAALDALGIREGSPLVWQAGATGPAGDPLARITEAFSRHSLLLILDNCEHLVTDAARFVQRLLASCPGVRILVTSREPLAVDGERLLPVPSLALPPEGALAEEVAEYPSARLFADRVSAVAPGFVVDQRNADHVARVCRELDGMPLALELAAARVRVMPLAQLASRLCDRFRLLTNGSRSALPRHQTLQAVVDWSWELLDEPERTLLRRFSVFSGGATIDAVERVCGDEGGPEIGGRDVWSVLFALVDKSLVVADPVHDETSQPHRYRMLATVHAYAAHRLNEAGEQESLHHAHAGHMLELFTEADPKLHTAEQLEWLSRLCVEHDNFAAAQRWAIDAGEVPLALDLFHVALCYHQLSDRWSDLGRHAGEILDLVGGEPPEGRVVSYVECVYIAAVLAEEEGAPDVEVRRAEVLLERAGIAPERHETLISMRVFQGVLGHDRTLMLGRLERAIDAGPPWLRATAKLSAGLVAMQAGRGQRARDLMADGLDDYRTLGDRWGIAHSILVLVDLERLCHPERELDLLEEGIRNCVDIGNTGMAAMLRCRRVLTRTVNGQVDAARDELTLIDTTSLGPDSLFMVRMAQAAVEWAVGAPARANTILRGVLRQAQDMGSIMRRYTEPACHAMLALTNTGDPDQLWRHAAASWANLDPGLDAALTGQIIEMLAEHAYSEDPERAVRLLGYAENVRGLPNNADPHVVRVRDQARQHLGVERYAEVYRSATVTGHELILGEIGDWLAGQAPQQPGPAPALRNAAGRPA